MSREREKNWREEVRRRVQKRQRYLGHEVNATPSEQDEIDLGESKTVLENEEEHAAEASSGVDSESSASMEPYDLALQTEDEFALRSDFSEDRETRRKSSEIGWSLEEAPSARAARPLERPATALERFKAALLDMGLLFCLSTVVVYFAAKAARTSVMNLGTVWLPLIVYLVFLGMMYATYFTGTTGSTPGKAFMGLKVVNSAGRPPTYARAFLRSLLGTAGILFGLIGLVPTLLDPARRALHDQLLRTRVIRR